MCVKGCRPVVIQADVFIQTGSLVEQCIETLDDVCSRDGEASVEGSGERDPVLGFCEQVRPVEVGERDLRDEVEWEDPAQCCRWDSVVQNGYERQLVLGSTLLLPVESVFCVAILRDGGQVLLMLCIALGSVCFMQGGTADNTGVSSPSESGTTVVRVRWTWLVKKLARDPVTITVEPISLLLNVKCVCSFLFCTHGRDIVFRLSLFCLLRASQRYCCFCYFCGYCGQPEFGVWHVARGYMSSTYVYV